jgi:hypothetical protein
VTSNGGRDAVAGGRAHRNLLVVVALLNLAVLVLTAGHQIYDTNFYTTWEATALRAGDHPYRDFFEWGAPLQAVVSLIGQLASGNRLIGEFGIQWLGIIAGAVISCHLCLKASRSVTASVATSVLAVAIVSIMATYHYPKLLLYPLATWMIWRYMEKPGRGRAAVVGTVTTVAFLFRHDHGVYVAAAAALGFVLTRVAVPSSRNLRAFVAETGVGALTSLALLAPWLLLVHTSEGLPQYVEARLQRYAVGSPYTNPYGSLLTMNPVRPLLAWSPAEGMLWLQQVSLLVPVLVLLGAVAAAVRGLRHREGIPADAARLAVAAALLAIVDWRTFREPGYAAAVAPLTAALAAPLVMNSRRTPFIPILGIAAVVLLIATVPATVALARQSEIVTPWRLLREAPDVFEKLMVSPPIDGFAPRHEVLAYDRSDWNTEQVHAVEVMMRYMHDCTAPGDRVLVTGQTPFHVGYYVERPIAGGHLFWHEGFRSDPARELQSLRLLQQQSVPFAYSTHDPVLDDFKRYPHIREYLMTNYTELDGSGGLLLIDRRRSPTGVFGKVAFPCFR